MSNSTPRRPAFHFTARQGWLNDPNGLIWLNGWYHLYFQHNPHATEWGDIHWGHARSRDLLHWEELLPVLYPKSEADMCFSGSAILDSNNVSGLGSKENPPLLVYFTSTGRGECVAYSLDEGMTFREYGGNPVITHAGRDPRVLKYADGHYVIAVYEEVNHIAFYRSPDLLHWSFCSRIHGFYECPELFELDGRWVLMGADTVYSLGEFDGESFTPQTMPQRLIEGDAYAGQSFANCERRIMMFWLRDRGLFHPLGFSQQMSLPVELTRNGDRLLVNPAVNISDDIFIAGGSGKSCINGIELPPAGPMRVIVDSGSVEAFINGGERCIMRTVEPAREAGGQ